MAEDPKLMDLEEFKKKLDPVLQKTLNKKIKSLTLHKNEDIKIYLQHLKKFMEEGKRIRPYLSYLTFKSAGGKNDKDAIELFVFIEIFHAFCLIHDDIMDKADYRHSIKTIHKFISDSELNNKYTSARHYGNSQAILIGDFMLTWALNHLINNKKFDERSIKRVLDIFFQMADEVVFGQMIDISLTKEKNTTDEKVLQKITLKTADYSFVKPMLIGATLAKEVKNKKFFEDFGKHLGIAFQTQDDLLDIKFDSKQTHKSSFSDVAGHQHTFFTNYIFRNGTKNQIETLNKFFGKRIGTKDYQKLRKVFADSGAMDYGEKIIKENFQTAKDILIKEKMDRKIKMCFEKLIEKIERRSS